MLKIVETEDKHPPDTDYLKLTRELLRSSLLVAVPLWYERVRYYSEETLRERARVCGEHVAGHGDVLMFREKKKTADAFNHLAEGIACGARVPGGIKYAGLHFFDDNQP